MAKSAKGLQRAVNTDKWSDPVMLDFTVEQKHLVNYLETNGRTTAAGAYKLHTGHAAYETELDRQFIERQLQAWSDDPSSEWGKWLWWWPEYRVVFLRDFFRSQPGSHEEPRFDKQGKETEGGFVTAARAVLAELPDEVRAVVVMEYPILGRPPGANGATPQANDGTTDDPDELVDDFDYEADAAEGRGEYDDITF